MVKKVYKFLLNILSGFASFIAIYFLAVYTLSAIPVKAVENNSQIVSVYILSNGVHTDLVVPYQSKYFDWSKLVSMAQTLATDTSFNYLAMGWGDKGFYLQTPQWKDLKVSVALKAATGLSSTAVHATFHQQPKEGQYCKKIVLSEQQYLSLIGYIQTTFELDDRGESIYIETNAQYGNHDAFFEAKGSYSVFRTCNTWANSALKIAGQKACVWTIFDTPILDKYN